MNRSPKIKRLQLIRNLVNLEMLYLNIGYRRERKTIVRVQYMKQEQLGDMVGTSRQAINAIETEKFEPSIWL